MLALDDLSEMSVQQLCRGKTRQLSGVVAVAVVFGDTSESMVYNTRAIYQTISFQQLHFLLMMRLIIGRVKPKLIL